ncbi:MAG: Pvc16 family protein, partial [Candidatus Thorarchaeota archaeon]
MGFEDTYKAIAAITAIIHKKLSPPLKIQVGAPRSNKDKDMHLFLYETIFDGHLKNYSYNADPKFKQYLLHEEKPSLVWLVLKYLLIASDEDNPIASNYQTYSDMGYAIRKLHDNSFLEIPDEDWIKEALSPRFEKLKVTFDEIPHDVISKILGDITSRYQFTISFQIRPVMIASGKVPISGYRVGIDSNNQIREDKGIVISSSLDKPVSIHFEEDEKTIVIDEINVSEEADDQEKKSKYLLSDLITILGGKQLILEKS